MKRFKICGFAKDAWVAKLYGEREDSLYEPLESSISKANTAESYPPPFPSFSLLSSPFV